MKSWFQMRWIILASELEKKKVRWVSLFSFLKLASYFLPDQCQSIKHSRNFKAVFNTFRIPSHIYFGWNYYKFMNMLAIPWLHFSANNYLWKKNNISLSSSVLFSGHLYSLLNSPALSHPQHQISLKLSTHPLLLHHITYYLLWSISSAVSPYFSLNPWDYPPGFIDFFFFIVFYFSSGNYHHMLALLQFSFPKWHLLLAIVTTNILG